jgi:hypothetical protein
MKHIKLFEKYDASTPAEGENRILQCVLTFSSIEIYGDNPGHWSMNKHTITTEISDQGSEEANGKAVVEELNRGNYEIGGDDLWCDLLEEALSSVTIKRIASEALKQTDPLDVFTDDLDHTIIYDACLADYWSWANKGEDEEDDDEEDGEDEIYDPEDALIAIYNDFNLEPKVKFETLYDDLSPEEVESYLALARLRKRII